MKVDAVAIFPSPALWHGPGAKGRAKQAFSWRVLLWALVFPAKRHRISATLPGVFLIALAMGIGTAAYNTASNILFITLSLLLACLLLSGLLSWFNLMGVCWRLRPADRWRAGHETLVTMEVRNAKAWLPTYGLWFDLAARPRRRASEADKPDKKEKIDVKAALAAAEREVARGKVFLRERIEPRGEVELDWVHRPEKRGEAVLELEGVGSFFPFGFLRKTIGTTLRQPVLVWPAQVDYQWKGATAALAGTQGQRTPRAGTGEDLLSLRKYSRGDSHRLIHWKASARLGQLMVRQFAAETLDGFVLRVDTPAGLWSRPEQFELLCSFAATLAEDLFAEGRLRAVGVNGRWIETRRVRDVEAVLDLLAVAEAGSSSAGGRPASTTGAGGTPALRLTAGETPALRTGARNLITFAPEGARGVTAYVDDVPTASA